MTIKELLSKTLNLIRTKSNNKLKFTIIANNCWGGEVYKYYQKPFNTPFIGLWVNASDYVKFLEKFDYYITQKLTFVQKDNIGYPVGKLADVEIYFEHYKSEQEALDKWERRKARLIAFMDRNPDKVFLKMCDREGGTAELLARFHQIPFRNKVSFGIRDLALKNHIVIEENEKHQTVPDGLRLFNISLRYFDVDQWIRRGKFIKLKNKT